MVFVLLAAMLLSMVTLSVMRLVAGDVTEGFGGLEAVQTFNVAEAGVHYAIGQLETGTGGTYAGEAITITSGATTLGTATITVNCLDGGSPSPTPCAGAYPGYRRVISTSTLPISGALGGPTRTVVAIVQATTGGAGGGGGGANNGYGICAYNYLSVQGPDIGTIHSDLGSNATIDTSTMSQAPYVIGTDPGVPSQYTGKAVAAGAITCKGLCSTQIQGGAFPSTSGTICNTLVVPTFTPGATPLTVTSAGFTINSGNATTYGTVAIAATAFEGTCPTYNTLTLDSGSVAGVTVVVQINTLWMDYCSRVAIIGVGKIDLRIGKTTGNTLGMNSWGGSPDDFRFGVCGDVHTGCASVDTRANFSPIPAGQLTVWVNSSCMPPGCTCNQYPPASGADYCAAQIAHTRGGGTINVPNGSLNFDDTCGTVGTTTAKWLLFTGCADFNSHGWLSAGSTPYSNFSILRSWKDQ